MAALSFASSAAVDSLGRRDSLLQRGKRAPVARPIPRPTIKAPEIIPIPLRPPGEPVRSNLLHRHPINLTNAELAQRLLELLEVAAIPEAHIKIVKEAAQRFIDMGD